MAEQIDRSRGRTFVAANIASTKDLIAKIKVQALLDFSRTSPEFQKELSLNAAKAAEFRGVDLDEAELDLLIRTVGQMQS